MVQLLGVDLGTTNTKAIVFDEHGNLLSQGTRRTPTNVEGNLRATYDAESIWQTVALTIRDALDGLGGPPAVDGVAMSSMAEAVVGVDAAGRPLAPVIAWFDDRTIPQRDWWRDHLGARAVFGICGLHLDYIFSINKVMWMREHAPDVFQRAVRWLGISDYVGYRLTGQQATSPSIASRTMAFDVAQREWSDRLLGMAELSRALFPQVLESGSLLGVVTADAARATGLPAGCPVLMGGHDHLCGALASRVIAPGPVLNSVGTSEVLLVAMDRFNPQDDDPERQGFSHGCHVVPGKYYAFGGTRGAGHLIEWLCRLFEKNLEENGDGGVYRTMVELGQIAPRGSRGLFVLPFVAGGRPHRDAEARGVFFGLRTSHSLSDIIRATFEGLSYELRRSIGLVEVFSGNPVQRLTAIGGGARNELWLRVKADVTGKPIDVSGKTESAGLGAALLAGLGAGVYRDLQEAMDRTCGVERTIEPDAEAHAQYSEWYDRVYLSLYPALRDSFLAAAPLFPED